MKIYQNLNKENVDSERREPATSDESIPQTVELTNISNKLKQGIIWFGNKLLEIAENVGEGVVSVLGLDDSHFQDVLDGMTEEEMNRAIAVHAERQEEYRQAGLLPRNDENESPDIENANAKPVISISRSENE